MPKREQLLQELRVEDDLGVLLMAQMDGVPDTVQVMVTSTKFDAESNGLREINHYVIRCIGVREHQISVGMFNSIRFLDTHPLLHQYNEDAVGVMFRGKVDNPNELILDIFQAYASTFGAWRHIPDYLNMAEPLIDLVSSGGGLLGQMPMSLATRMKKVLEHHKLETNLVEAKQDTPPVKVLLMDESYVVAMDFTVEELVQKR